MLAKIKTSIAKLDSLIRQFIAKQTIDSALYPLL
ncbi:Hypothetical protein GSB_153660 [Giardia duodenalis]|uniref:Uncharacterized protein n=1 Tax=Giardia intestinalis TaxID=5741 RepID=V6TWZ8_GIAIN|nr:Hypothetical protein GSB_153660 [Giardia intestinalis]